MSPETPEHRRSRMDNARPGVPRWVKLFAVIGAVIVVLVVVLLLSGHGPSRHGGQGSSASTISLDTRR
jgi:hypothetical protein